MERTEGEFGCESADVIVVELQECQCELKMLLFDGRDETAAEESRGEGQHWVDC